MKDVKLDIRISEREKDVATRKAKQCGFDSVSAFLRYLLRIVNRHNIGRLLDTEKKG